MRVLTIVVMIVVALASSGVASAQDATVAPIPTIRPLNSATNAQDASCVATPEPVTGTDRVTFSGDGDDLIDIGQLDTDVYIVTGTYNGPDFWNVQLTGRVTGNIELVFVIEDDVPFDGQTLLTIRDQTVDNYLMEVTAYGPWTISFEKA